MSPRIYLDFETRSEVDLKAVGAWVYSTHPSTRVLCMAWALDSEKVVRVCGREYFNRSSADKTFAMLAFGQAIHESQAIMIAHNSFFELCIWNNVLFKNNNVPFPIPKENWRCSAALARQNGLPGKLADVAVQLSLPHTKSMGGRSVMLKLSKPKKGVNGSPKWHASSEDLEELYRYCKTDVLVLINLWGSLPSLSKTEEAIWQLDSKINLRGIAVDHDLVDQCIILMSTHTKVLNTRLKVLSNGDITTAFQTARILKWLAQNGVLLPNLTKQTVENALGSPNIPENSRALLSLRKELSKTSIKKFHRLKISSPDRQFRGALVYHGAHTGRWAGRMVQLHNLPRGSVKDVDLAIKDIGALSFDNLQSKHKSISSLVSSMIRGAFIPTKGRRFIDCDYSNIETRILFWLAGEDLALQMLREGKDLYVAMAKTIYKKQGEVSAENRSLGKQAILGCGYGMGAERFLKTCDTYNLNVSEYLAQEAVKAYRTKYYKVTQFWRDLENFFRKILNVKGDKPLYLKLPHITIPAWFSKKDNALVVQLPSKRLFRYNRMRIDATNQVAYQSPKGMATHTWGGGLVENLCQAIARDILCHHMLELDDLGFDIVLHVHDEILVDATSTQTLEQIKKVMCVSPSWGKNLPLAVTGWEGNRYKK
jgi:DNA polymerase